jgi:hypothetical protein
MIQPLCVRGCAESQGSTNASAVSGGNSGVRSDVPQHSTRICLPSAPFEAFTQTPYIPLNVGKRDHLGGKVAEPSQAPGYTSRPASRTADCSRECHLWITHQVILLSMLAGIPLSNMMSSSSKVRQQPRAKEELPPKFSPGPNQTDGHCNMIIQNAPATAENPDYLRFTNPSKKSNPLR